MPSCPLSRTRQRGRPRATRSTRVGEGWGEGSRASRAEESRAALWRVGSSDARTIPRVTPPGPLDLIPFRTLYRMSRDITGFLARLHHDYGDVAAFRLGHRRIHLLSHPDHI